MADTPLFELDAERRWRLAYDGEQWVLQRRTQKAHTRQIKGHAARDSGFRGVWFVGSRKATLVRGFRRFGVELTPEAQSKFDDLPDTFPRLRREVEDRALRLSSRRPERQSTHSEEPPGAYAQTDIDCGQYQ
jgi:hypothetical protein